ncbi:GNAT family N-acetyltransferase [Dactylosporangium sucinum]|uniref:N-acetyltransferase n=1 Tax=Dactylosporangium sucinum TaxID=1424081 RepID=A0A917UJN2_9ACTN|nr:GNAT family N-acetyltransferase [Dactylosporangium sucinum]GGM90893.1 N-acetyltransferase [Dactylosporangium sucinum]
MQYDIRPIRGRDELDLFRSLPYQLNDELDDDLAAGRRRPDWMWVATGPDGRLAARTAWWSRTGEPYLLDILDYADGREDAADALLATAMRAVLPVGTTPPAYTRFLRSDWRDTEAGGVRGRMAVAERAGASLLVERLRLEWRAGTPVRADEGRLRYRGFRDDDEALDLMTATLDGTLDAHSRADLASAAPREVAAEHFHGELERWPSPREWWRVATLPDGEPVGFVFPARNDYNPIIAYLGVLPAHRGHGYIHDVLAEGTRVLAAQDVPRIRATTDVGNTPMAAAFAAAGYVNFEREVVMTWS